MTLPKVVLICGHVFFGYLADDEILDAFCPLCGVRRRIVRIE